MPIESSVQKVLSSFSAFIKEDKLNNIPDLEFKNDNDMYRIAQALSDISVGVELTKNEGLSDEVKIVDAIFAALDEKMSSDDMVSIINELGDISNKFAIELENCFVIITEEIAGAVNELLDKVKENYIRFMHREGYEELLEEDEKQEVTEDDFHIVKWKNVKAAGDKNDIISAACANVNLKHEELNPFNLGVIIEKLMFITDFESIIDNRSSKIISKETRDLIVESFKEFYQKDTSEVSDDNIELFTSLITDAKEYAAFCRGIQSKMKNNKETIDMCVELLELCNAYKVFAINMKKGKPDISDKLSEQSMGAVLNNVDVVMKTIYASWYFCLYHKENTFKDKIILNKTCLNSDVYDNAMSDGITIVDIYDFIRAFYADTPMPLIGISMDAVKNSKTADRIQKKTAALKLDGDMAKTKCLKLSIAYTLREYARGLIGELDIKDATQEYAEYMRKVDQKIIYTQSNTHGDFDRLEDSLYGFIIKMFYEDSLVYTLYLSLGKEYTKLAKEVTNIEDTDIVTANVKVSIDLILSYLINKLCK